MKIFNKQIFNKKMEVKLLLSIVFAFPAIFLWGSSLISIIYINFLASWIYSLGELSEFILFLLLPFAGLFFATLSWRQNGKKAAKIMVVVNVLLLLSIVAGSIYLL